MIRLGEIQTLVVAKLTSVGVYLNDCVDELGSILLPNKYVPEGAMIGDEIEVFVYKDSEDRFVATTVMPKITLGQVELLKVVDNAKIGSFVDWGLEKDLFVPFKEQTVRAKKGKDYLVGLYIDKSERLCGTMDIYNMLDTNSPYQSEDTVEGYIYQINDRLGAFVAIDKKYQGLISASELGNDYKVGDYVSARVIKVREDGKLDLSTRKKIKAQMSEDAEKILSEIDVRDGFIALNDKSSPEEIKEDLGMSKAAFKRAVGRLLKEEKIMFVRNGIRKNG